MMRAKMRVADVQAQGDYEALTFQAVCRSEGYPADGSDENNTYAHWTPWAELKMSVTNPELHGKFKVGDEFYVDFTKVAAP